MGAVDPELDSDEVLQIVETRRGSYRKLIVRGGTLVGAIMVGNTTAAANLVQVFDRGEPLPDDPLEALCPGAVPATGAGGDRMICNCNKVTESRLRAAIEGGATSVEELGACTLAGTGCGSCKSDLKQLLTRHLPRPRVAAAG
jgi:nitrite reductase (NADH) large subunit